MCIYDRYQRMGFRAAVMAALFGCGDLSAGAIDSDSVRLCVRAVAGWQLDNRDANGLNVQSWRLAPFYAATVRAAAVTGDPGYYEAMRQVGELAQWQPGARTYHADDHAVGMMYCDMSRFYGVSAYSEAMLARLDFILANPSTQGVCSNLFVVHALACLFHSGQAEACTTSCS